jgi:hypothetical protein
MVAPEALENRGDDGVSPRECERESLGNESEFHFFGFYSGGNTQHKNTPTMLVHPKLGCFRCPETPRIRERLTFKVQTEPCPVTLVLWPCAAALWHSAASNREGIKLDQFSHFKYTGGALMLLNRS